MSGLHRLGFGLAGLLLLSAASAPPPTITAGQIISTSVDVTQPPPAPKVKLQIRGTADLVTFAWIGPSGETFSQSFNSGTWKGAVDFQGYNPATPPTYNAQAFSLYTEAGTWTLGQVSVCADFFTNCSTYTGQTLKALFGTLTIQVVNPNPADIEPPSATAAAIETPTVSIANSPTLQINLKASDTVSGIYSITVGASTPNTFPAISVYSNATSSVVQSAIFRMTTTVAAGTATGTYTVTYVYLADLAGNSINITDPTTISRLFRGKPSFVVTN